MDETIHKLESILDALCGMTGRRVAIFYPKEHSEIVTYLKKEINKTLEFVK